MASPSTCSRPNAGASTRCASVRRHRRQRNKKDGRLRRKEEVRVRSGFVAIIGRPNAGNSTLLNRVIGEKIAIVSDKPQTTRTRILGVKNYAAGQIVFVDTPGIHRPLHRMNVRMVDAAVDSLQEVDVAMLVHDASTRPGKGDEYVSKLLSEATVPVILVLQKPGGLTRIYCTILVEQESQKPIVIGRAGDMIKRIGTEARLDLEASLGGKVFLDLRVKVKADWRDDERVLDDLGLPRRQ